MIGWGKGFLTEAAKFLLAKPPVDTTGAAVTSLYVSMKNYRRLLWLVAYGVKTSTDAQTIALTQATDSAGTGVKALSFDTGLSWKSVGQSQTAASDVLVANTVTSDTAPVVSTDDNSLFFINVRGDMLDINNSFCYCGLTITSPGAHADLVCVIAIAYDGWFSGKETTLPSVVSG